LWLLYLVFLLLAIQVRRTVLLILVRGEIVPVVHIQVGMTLEVVVMYPNMTALASLVGLIVLLGRRVLLLKIVAVYFNKVTLVAIVLVGQVRRLFIKIMSALIVQAVLAMVRHVSFLSFIAAGNQVSVA
jgi:hypothetical protein